MKDALKSSASRLWLGFFKPSRRLFSIFATLVLSFLILSSPALSQGNIKPRPHPEQVVLEQEFVEDVAYLLSTSEQRVRQHGDLTSRRNTNAELSWTFSVGLRLGRDGYLCSGTYSRDQGRLVKNSFRCNRVEPSVVGGGNQ